VLAAVEDHPHASADIIAAAARKKCGSLSTQAVYDNLHALVGAGLLRRIQPAGHPAMYETRLDDNHHHLVCRSCGLTMDVDCSIGSAACLTPINQYGFHIDEAEVTYWGFCPTCQPKQTVRRKVLTEILMDKKHPAH